MLDVPLDELVAGREQEMHPDQARFAVKQGKHVLELVAETDGPARLVEPERPQRREEITW